nr:MAG TPA: hypothetical protein [Bacteriophage sp.]
MPLLTISGPSGSLDYRSAFMHFCLIQLQP